MKIFGSSEMQSAPDKARRQAAIKTLREMGHDPVYFEAQPARPMPKGVDAREFCRRLVRSSEAIAGVIDDTVTDAMTAELGAAEEDFGRERMFYYFVEDADRDEVAEALWESEKESNKLATFKTVPQLAKEIRRTIGSYIDDALRKSRPVAEVMLDAQHEIKTDALAWWRIDCEAGDCLQVTCHGDYPFYAGFVNTARFVKLRSNNRASELATGKDERGHFFDVKIDYPGEYYLVVRRSFWQASPVPIQVRIVRRRGGFEL